jgi:DNA-binding SARP family transcriptional activator
LVARPARLALLDGFELVCGGRVVPLPVTAQRLLAFLALHDWALLRGYVAGSLYLEKSEERACANLRSALWRLRQPGYKLVEADTNHLRLAPEVVVDVREVSARARRLSDLDSPPDERDLDEAPFSHDLLPDWYDEWVITERERLRQRRLHALEALCLHLTRLGRFARAIDAGLAAVAAEPLRESSHRALIEAHLAEGNHSEAIRQYRSYAALLQNSLGVAPSARLIDLVETASHYQARS